MKKSLLLLWALILCSIPGLRAQNASNPFVHCLVLDKTMSMTGHGGTDIWADVQNYCYEWIDGVPESSTLLLFTFDRDVYGPQKFEINSASDREKAKEVVRNINVDGRNTWISSSLDKAVKYVYDNYPKSQYNSVIYLVTDGREEQLEANFAGVLQNYSSKRGDYDYLYYVDLRDMATPDIIGPMDDTDGCGRGKGFAKFLTIQPLMKVVNCVLGGSQSFEQHFLVNNEALFSEMAFDLMVDSVKKVGRENLVPNVTLNPSRNIKMQQAVKMEDGKYKVKFALVFCDEFKCECDVYVSLAGRNKGDKFLNFQPSQFVVKVRKKTAPILKVKDGTGWH